MSASPPAARGPVRTEGILAAPVDDQAVLWHPAARTSHVLNATATEVWRRCDGARSPAEIADELAATYDTRREVVRADVDALLDQLRDEGLVDAAAVDGPVPRTWPEVLPRPSHLDPAHRRAVDEHRWRSSGTTYAAFDFTFTIHDETDLFDRALGSLLAPLAIDATDSADAHLYTIRSAGERSRLSLDGRKLARATPGSLARFLVWHVNRMAVASVPDHLVLHAGGVRRDEHLVVLAASMNSGKSTLTASLVANGWEYLSDEALALDPRTGDVRPYPRSITLDRGSWTVLATLAPPHREAHEDLFGSWHVDPRSIRPASLGRGGRPSALVFPIYDADAHQATCAPLLPADALTRLLANTFDFGALGQAGLDHLAALVRSVPVRELRYARLEDAWAAIDATVDETTARLR